MLLLRSIYQDAWTLMPVMRVPAYGTRKENILASGIRASLSLTDPVIVPGMSDISPRILCPLVMQLRFEVVCGDLVACTSK